jgi:hypothetical protein
MVPRASLLTTGLAVESPNGEASASVRMPPSLFFFPIQCFLPLLPVRVIDDYWRTRCIAELQAQATST